MEARLKGKGHDLLGVVGSGSENEGKKKKSLEWDLNEWRWDGDLFTATPLVISERSECLSKHLFPVAPDNARTRDLATCGLYAGEEVAPGNDSGERVVEKRRKIPVVEERDSGEEGGCFDLNLGGQPCPETDVDMKGRKKVKYSGSAVNCPGCQVQGCEADLNNARNYHRRHKVCEMHSKASEALVRNVLQRFCQQCSRFHLLEEFDEGKRSCRRRLAGHNKRRRKADPDAPAPSGPVPDEKNSSFLLISLLRMLSNIHLSSLDQTRGQDLLSHLLRNLADAVNGQNPSGMLQETTNVGPLLGNQEKINGAMQNESGEQHVMQVATNAIQEALNIDNPGGINLKNIDLNCICDDDMEGIIEVSGRCSVHEGSKYNHHCTLLEGKQDVLKSSPPRPPSNSSSGHSPSSSSGEDQSRTDRIVFKLFGKDPNDLPTVLRSQILQWLSHSPTEMESYIKPGCIVLTIYLRLKNSMWEELSHDLGTSLSKLLDLSSDPFWRSGWIYTRLQDFASFIHDGSVVLEAPLLLKHRSCRITSISPIAITFSTSAQFSVKGYNLVMPKSKLFCVLEGKYLVQEDVSDLVGGVETGVELDVLQSLNFQCSVPKTCGRGFIEVEDYSLTNSFFPFIVAEEDVCLEIRTLESSLDAFESSLDVTYETRNVAIEFLHEFGWLLHQSHLTARLKSDNHTVPKFPFGRFRWLVEFSMENDWCAVVKKLLGIVCDGVIDADGCTSLDAALSRLGLLHVAVRRNSRPMVELLLRYTPKEHVDDAESDLQLHSYESQNNFLFKPDAVDVGGLTPLHIAASMSGSEHVLDALTDDPLSIGVEVWKTARDSSGLTPNDYASLRGYYSYIRLVQRKVHGKFCSREEHVIVDVPYRSKPKPSDELGPTKSFGLEDRSTRQKSLQADCKLCDRKLAWRLTRTSQIARPAMVCMVAVATICVCAALLFKSSPNVVYCFRPFVWEKLPYGAS
ncbi:hypothetical protein MLD38_010740 [Melastoma candidum]|uniref:Uncharacterized protein n=1 Tax=Melastoma candidum TaxID=119954 RepID=A0ACB9R0V9_9MYRT|nr:hypothetical protein MLD38_010740 [Melastoma candidum]